MIYDWGKADGRKKRKEAQKKMQTDFLDCFAFFAAEGLRRMRAEMRGGGDLQAGNGGAETAEHCPRMPLERMVGALR
jgi:hypothetical protein